MLVEQIERRVSTLQIVAGFQKAMAENPDDVEWPDIDDAIEQFVKELNSAGEEIPDTWKALGVGIHG